MMRKFKGSRRLLAIAASLTMLTGLFSTGFGAAAGGFDAAQLDPAVAAAVREAAALEEGGAITAEAMKDVSYLDLAGAGVVSLYGLEYAENLMWLDLSGNPDIQAIPAGLFDGMPGLGYVDLSGLSLSALPDNLFKTQIDDMTSRLDNTVWDEYGWDDPVYFTLIMGRMPAKAELWDDMRALRTALEAVQTKGDEVFAAEPEAEESPALIEVQMGLALIYPSKLEALEAENGQLIHLQDLAGTETIDTASAAKLLTVMCMTVADLFDFDLLDLLDIPDAPGMPDSLVLNDLLVKDFNGLMDTGDEEMNEQFLASLIESAQMAEIDVADSYADFNAFFADLLKKAQGIDYKAGDPVSAPLLALLNEAAEALELPAFDSIPSALVGIMSAALQMKWNDETLLGEMYKDLMDLTIGELLALLPEDAGMADLPLDVDPAMTIGELANQSVGVMAADTSLYMLKAASGEGNVTLELFPADADKVTLTAKLDGKEIPVTAGEDGALLIAVPRNAGSYMLEIQSRYKVEQPAFADLDVDTSLYTYLVQVRVMPSTACALTGFKLAGVAGVIDEANKTVTVTVPAGTDVKALTAEGVTVSYKATHDASGAKDYTGAVTVKVVAEDGIHFTVYTVTVKTANPSTGVPAESAAAALGLLSLAAVLVTVRKRRASGK